MVFVLSFTSNHILVKFKCSIHCYVQFRHVYLIMKRMVQPSGVWRCILNLYLSLGVLSKYSLIPTNASYIEKQGPRTLYIGGLRPKKLKYSIWERKIGLEDFTFRFILENLSATIWCLEVHIVVDFGVSGKLSNFNKYFRYIEAKPFNP